MLMKNLNIFINKLLKTRKNILILCILLMLINLSLVSCRYKQTSNKTFNIDQQGVEYLVVSGDGNNWYIKDGEKTNVYKLSEKELNDINYKGARDMFFINNELIVFIMYNKIYYYDIKENKIIRRLSFDNMIGVSYGNDRGDIYINQNELLYKYNYQNKDLEIITDRFPSTISKLVYCKQKDSIFYDDYGYLYELSLNDNQSILRFSHSYLIEYINEEKKLYFYNWDKNQVKYASIDTFEEKEILKKKDINSFMIFKDIIWINTMDKNRDINLSDILIGEEMYTPSSQFLEKKSDEFNWVVDFRINDDLYNQLNIKENKE